MPSQRLATLLMCAYLAGAGCAEPSTVSGTVTYDGQRLPHGYITFLPADATGVSTGADIVNGAYLLTDASPGKRRALVTVPPRVLSKTPKLKLGVALRIPASATGNNEVVEIRPGKQIINIDIHKPM